MSSDVLVQEGKWGVGDVNVTHATIKMTGLEMCAAEHNSHTEILQSEQISEQKREIDQGLITLSRIRVAFLSVVPGRMKNWLDHRHRFYFVRSWEFNPAFFCIQLLGPSPATSQGTVPIGNWSLDIAKT